MSRPTKQEVDQACARAAALLREILAMFNPVEEKLVAQIYPIKIEASDDFYQITLEDRPYKVWLLGHLDGSKRPVEVVFEYWSGWSTAHELFLTPTEKEILLEYVRTFFFEAESGIDRIPQSYDELDEAAKRS